ncbi:hypothetical protein L1887_33233 [Cichorium endivia]|nr:hypothetical protein L1887_33233 [Cichorium endivia]
MRIFLDCSPPLWISRRYHVVKETKKHWLATSTIPDQCSPIHLNLVARHGTRDPTKNGSKAWKLYQSNLNPL